MRHRGRRRRPPDRPRWSRRTGCCRRRTRRTRPGSRSRCRRQIGSGGARQRRHSDAAQLGGGLGEVDDRVEPAGERVVDVGAQVGGQHGQPVEGLQPLQQVGALDVGVAVVGVSDVAALAEDRVGLVEEQHGVDPAGLGEDALQVLLGLADVLVHHRGQVHRVEVEPEIRRDHLGRHRLAGAGVAGEQRGHPVSPAAAAPHPPVGEHRVAMPGPRGDLLQPAQHRRGQHQVLPADLGLDPPRQPLEPGGVLRPDAAAQVVGGDRPAGHLGRRLGGARRPCGPGPDRGRGGRRGDAGSSDGSCGPSSRSHSASRSRPPSTGASASSGPSVDHCGSQVVEPDQQHRYVRAGQPVQRLGSGLGQRLDRAGDQPRAEQQRLADRQIGERGGVGRGDPASRPRSTVNAPIPAAVSAATPIAAPVPATFSRRWTSLHARGERPSELLGDRGRVAARRRSIRPASPAAGASSPSRWAPTRSGTRSPRVRNGRSESSTTTRPRRTSGRLDSRRARAAARHGRLAGELRAPARPRRAAG